MLQKLNERIQGVFAWVVIGLVAVTFALFGVEHYLQSRHEASAQVEINGKPITKQSFELNYRRTRQMRQPAQLTVTGENQLKQQVLDQMILNQVSVDAARKAGFEVTPEQANAAILNIPQFQQDGHFSAARYEQAILGALFTPESFQNEVRQGMLLNQQRFAFIGTAFAQPNEIQQFVKLYMQARDYRYLEIPARPFLKSIHVADKEINDYYLAHKKEFLAPEKVSLEYVQLSMQDIKKSIKVTDEQIKRYYEDNQSQPAMNKPLADVQEEIKTQLLADLAQTEYARVLDHLADLSYQTPDTLVPVANALKLKIEPTEPFSRFGGETKLTKNKAVLQAAFSRDILELGNNSEPIQLDNDSVIVLRVHKHIPTVEKSLAEVKTLITETLAWKKAESKASELGHQLLDIKSSTAFDQLLTEHHLKWHDIKHATRDTDEAPTAIHELAFSIPKVKEERGRRMSGAFVIAELSAIYSGDLASLDKEQTASITQQIEANYGLMDYDLYVRGLLHSANIVRH